MRPVVEVMGHQVEVAIWDQVVMALGGQVSIKKLKQTKKEIRGKKNTHETIATIRWLVSARWRA